MKLRKTFIATVAKIVACTLEYKIVAVACAPLPMHRAIPLATYIGVLINITLYYKSACA